jgi:hypothetical protein
MFRRKQVMLELASCFLFLSERARRVKRGSDPNSLVASLCSMKCSRCSNTKKKEIKPGITPIKSENDGKRLMHGKTHGMRNEFYRE